MITVKSSKLKAQSSIFFNIEKIELMVFVLSGRSRSKKNKPSFGLRIASVFLMVIPHIVTHIGLGAVKGLEIGATRPADFLNRHCKKIGKEGSTLSAFGGHVGTFVGSLVGFVTLVPGLLIGTVAGLGRIIMTVKKLGGPSESYL
jgi:hypothetical protein